MKKILALVIVLMLLGCNQKEKENLTQQVESNEKVKDKMVVKPKEKWDVRKEYDEFGNLIKYDSIYSWAYSNIEGDSLHVNLDSIMDSFRRYFGDRSPFKLKEEFFYFPKNDSLFKYEFFKDDYFFSNWQKQHSELEDMIKRMDSSRNAFLKRFHPGLLESKQKN